MESEGFINPARNIIFNKTGVFSGQILCYNTGKERGLRAFMAVETAQNDRSFCTGGYSAGVEAPSEPREDRKDV